MCKGKAHGDRRLRATALTGLAGVFAREGRVGVRELKEGHAMVKEETIVLNQMTLCKENDQR